MKWFIAAWVLLMGGCSTMTPEQKVALEQNAARPVICSKGDDCDVKWGRALSWVLKNSSWKIQSQSDNLIQTFTPINASAASGFIVNKVPLGNGQFQIVMTSGCDNFLGCIPDAITLKASFNQFVDGQ